MIVLDTNIVILYIKNDREVVQWLKGQRSKGELFCISTITVVELLGYPKISAEEAVLIEIWMRRISTIDLDLSIAREAARLRRELKLRASDAVIAATAVLLHSSVATRDMAFKKIRDIKVLVP